MSGRVRPRGRQALATTKQLMDHTGRSSTAASTPVVRTSRSWAAHGPTAHQPRASPPASASTPGAAPLSTSSLNHRGFPSPHWALKSRLDRYQEAHQQPRGAAALAEQPLDLRPAIRRGGNEGHALHRRLPHVAAPRGSALAGAAQIGRSRMNGRGRPGSGESISRPMRWPSKTASAR